MTVPILTFLSVTLGVAGLFYVFSQYFDADRERTRRRLAQEFGHAGTTNVPSLYKNLDALALDSAQDYALLSGKNGARRQNASGDKKGLTDLLLQAGLPLSPFQFVTVALGIALVVASLGFAILGWPGSALGGSLGGVLPFIVLIAKRKSRRDRFLKQLPNALELMARVIRAGQSVPQALLAVTDAFEDPIAEEFGRCLHQQHFGLDSEIVFQEMAARSGITEVRVFVMALAIHRQCGGHLSDILERLANLIRGRIRLRQHVHTHTAEGRMQALALVILPFLMFIAMLFFNHSYAMALLAMPKLILATFLLMGIGIFWMHKIIGVEE